MILVVESYITEDKQSEFSTIPATRVQTIRLQIIYNIFMCKDLALNHRLGLKYHEMQPTNQPINQNKKIYTVFREVLLI